jgi:hypothetical protein
LYFTEASFIQTKANSVSFETSFDESGIFNSLSVVIRWVVREVIVYNVPANTVYFTDAALWRYEQDGQLPSAKIAHFALL